MTNVQPCTLYLQPETWAELLRMAQADGISRPMLLRRILEEATETGAYEKTTQS